MSNHLKRGFVVPVWVGSPSGWYAAWALPDGSHWAALNDHRRLPGEQFRPRDPNRADGGDRPDLLEQP